MYHFASYYILALGVVSRATVKEGRIIYMDALLALGNILHRGDLTDWHEDGKLHPRRARERL